MIDGVTVTPLPQFHDERGNVMHMLKTTDSIFEQFGEIYFSTTFPGSIKAWHVHKKMTLNYSIVCGKIKLVLYDDREKSETKGTIQEIFLSTENYNVITVPPLIWNGFKAISNEISIVANCSDIPHDPNEIIRKPFDHPSIPYNWEIKHK